MFVASKAFGMIWVRVDLILLNNRNFCTHEIIFHFVRRVILSWFFLQNINKQIIHVIIIFKNCWSYISILSSQIAIDCLVFDRFCFLCVVCLFWWFYGFLWRVFAIEKLEYSRYNAKIKYESFSTVLIVVFCFLILTDLTKVLLSFVWLKFSSFGWCYDGWRNKE